MTQENSQHNDDFENLVVRFQAGALSPDEVAIFESLLRNDEGKLAVYLEMEKRSAEIARLLERKPYSLGIQWSGRKGVQDDRVLECRAGRMRTE